MTVHGQGKKVGGAVADQGRAGARPARKRGPVGGFPSTIGGERGLRLALHRHDRRCRSIAHALSRPPYLPTQQHARTRWGFRNRRVQSERANRILHGIGCLSSICSARRTVPASTSNSKEEQSDKTKAQASSQRRYPHQLAATACRRLPRLAVETELYTRDHCRGDASTCIMGRLGPRGRLRDRNARRRLGGLDPHVPGKQVARAPQGAARLFIAHLRDRCSSGGTAAIAGGDL